MKKLTLFLFAIAMLLAFKPATYAKSFSVCITMNTNEQLDVTNTYVGNGLWSLSGAYNGGVGQNLGWTISGTSDAYADTLYAKMTNPNPNDCNVSYDYL